MEWGKMFLKGKDIYELRNQSNETVHITAYVCYARKDLFFNPYLNESNNGKNVYFYLATGFAENGFDINSQTTTQDALTVDSFTPFMSRFFVRQFKIGRVKKLKIGPGRVLKQTLSMKWRHYTPADMTMNTGAATAWISRARRFDVLKGERFILFKLHSNVGGVSGQTSLEKNVAQTTPTVIMRTYRRYWAKHFPRTRQPLVYYTPYGIAAAGTAASIIVDADEQKGAEIDAS